jgi:N-acetyl-gamma-glutamyl-phosphate reductase
MSLIANAPVPVNFTPHLLPISRGLLSTAYARVKKRTDIRGLHNMFNEAYEKEPFVRVLKPGAMPNVKNVRGTNLCEIGLAYNEKTSTVIVVTAIDNLIKGASGQAVQCMNIMMGYKETTSLLAPAVYP